MPVYVNTVEITDDAVFKEMQYHPAASQALARDTAARALVIKELMRQAAVDHGLLDDAASDDLVDAGIMTLVQQNVSVPNADRAACKRYYRQNIERFKVAGKGLDVLPFQQVENKIQDYLHARSWRQGIQFYIQSLAGRAKIIGFDLCVPI